MMMLRKPETLLSNKYNHKNSWHSSVFSAKKWVMVKYVHMALELSGRFSLGR